MGDFRKYKCSKCGYEKEFSYGHGFLNTNKYEKEKELVIKLKEDIENGYYGEFLQETVNLPNSNHQLIFNCSESIFQCSKCQHLTVANKKEIISGIIKKYEQRITFNQQCPKCKKGDLKEISFINKPFCPNCKQALLECTLFGNWD